MAFGVTCMKYSASRDIYLIIIKNATFCHAYFPLLRPTTEQTKVPGTCFILSEYILT